MSLCIDWEREREARLYSQDSTLLYYLIREIKTCVFCVRECTCVCACACVCGCGGSDRVIYVMHCSIRLCTVVMFHAWRFEPHTCIKQGFGPLKMHWLFTIVMSSTALFTIVMSSTASLPACVHGVSSSVQPVVLHHCFHNLPVCLPACLPVCLQGVH